MLMTMRGPSSAGAFCSLLLLLQSLTAVLASPVQYSFGPRADLPLIGANFGVPGSDETFDDVIVGGGTAGLVMATRLAQNKSSVAVIEAGGFVEVDNGNYSVIPAAGVRFSGADPKDTQPLVDWSFVTPPQPVFIIFSFGSCETRHFMYIPAKCGGNAFTTTRGATLLTMETDRQQPRDSLHQR